MFEKKLVSLVSAVITPICPFVLFMYEQAGMAQVNSGAAKLVYRKDTRKKCVIYCGIGCGHEHDGIEQINLGTPIYKCILACGVYIQLIMEREYFN